jgi:hypothetical protein
MFSCFANHVPVGEPISLKMLAFIALFPSLKPTFRQKYLRRVLQKRTFPAA